MIDLQLIQSVFAVFLSGVAIIGIPLGVYKFYVKDQKDDEKASLTLSAKIDLINVELRHLTDAFMLIKQNDLHTITEKQRDQDSQIGKMTVAIEKLATVIDERVPRKTVDKVT